MIEEIYHSMMMGILIILAIICFPIWFPVWAVKKVLALLEARSDRKFLEKWNKEHATVR